MKFYALMVLCLGFNLNLNAQGNVVAGTVTDTENNKPLENVQVTVKGTTITTKTANDGSFRLTGLSDDAVLFFSLEGFFSETVELEGAESLNIVLQQVNNHLNDSVAIGYGSVKRSELAGAIVSVKQEDIMNTPFPNVLQSMQGKISGFDITRYNGEAGTDIGISFRGTSSFYASNRPLVLVDGIEYGHVLDINASDIESIEVLKDGASSAIYGIRGSNGVVLVTTKRGSEGKVKIYFNSQVSFNSPSFIPDVMNSSQYIQKRHETIIANEENRLYNLQRATYNHASGEVSWNRNQHPQPWDVFGTVSLQDMMDMQGVDNPNQLVTFDPDALELIESGVSLNYLDMILRNSITDSYELGLLGGTKNTGVNLSLGVMNDRGMLNNDELKRYNIKAGLDQNITRNMKIGANVLLNHRNNRKRDVVIFQQAIKTGTIGRLYNDDGSYRHYPDEVFTFNQPNPMLNEIEDAYLYRIKSNRIFGSAYFNWEFLRGLTFNSTIGINNVQSEDGLYHTPETINRLALGTASARLNDDAYKTITFDNKLNYILNTGMHKIDFLLGNSLIESTYENIYILGEWNELPTEVFEDWFNYSAEWFIRSGAGSGHQNRAFFTRAHYSFNGRYIFQTSLRADVSSSFSPDNKWSYYPSASIAWRIDQEGFLSGINMLSNLKFRVGWGRTGNTIQPFTQLPASELGYLPNLGLKAEQHESWNMGLDFGFFNWRINGAVEYYLTNSKDLIVHTMLPGRFGYISILANSGEIINKGVELYLRTTNILNHNFRWDTDFNFNMNRNEVVKLFAGPGFYLHGGNRIYQVGERVNIFKNLDYTGIYQISDLQAEYQYIAQQHDAGLDIDRSQIPMISNNFVPGDVKIRDVNNDGAIDSEDLVVKNDDPKYILGLSNSFYIGNWGLSFLVYARLGQTLQYEAYWHYKPGSLLVENGIYVDAWTPQNPGASFPRYKSSGDFRPGYVDGSFVKIRDITLSYKLPENLYQALRMSNFRVYVTGRNLITFSGIQNYDPEMGGGIFFPTAKQVITGVNLEF